MKRRLPLIVAALLLLGWAGYAVAGERVAQLVAGRFGLAILRIGKGKITDAALFVHHRLHEALWLATLTVLWAAVHTLLERGIQNRGRNRWVLHGVIGFAGVNLWLGAAMHTGLFWAAMGAGGGVQNLMQFHLKRILMAENPAPIHAVLVGSSQTRAEINEEQLNEQLGQQVWTTELHFPGSHAYDVLLIERQLRQTNPQLVICYVSEGYFYLGSHGLTVPNFLEFQDLPDARHRGAPRFLSRQEIFYGLLGDALPLFRCREVLAFRLLGATSAQLKQQAHDEALEADLDTRAKEFAASFHLSAESHFQKQAFEDFVARCEKAGRRVFLLTGGYHPALRQRTNPAIRADMLAFLSQLQQRYTNVVVVPESEFPGQTAGDYEDLSHVNEAMQRRYTHALTGIMARYLPDGQNAKRLTK